MRGVTITPEVRRRRLWIRIGLLAVYAGLVTLAFVTGKAHTVLIDNKDSEQAEGIDGVLVSVNGGEQLELYRGDRDRALVKGQRLRVRIELFDGAVTEKRLRLPVGQEMVLLSVPALLAGSDRALEPFTPLNVTSPPEEEEPLTSEGLPGELMPESLEEQAAPPAP
jgi:hypothetical protein